MNRLLLLFFSLTISLQLVSKESSFFINGSITTNEAIAPESSNVDVLSAPMESANNEWTIVPDRVDATYQIGETANFIITSTVGGNISYSIFYDERTPVLSSGTLNVPINTPVSIPFTLNESGVVLCKVTMNGTSKLAAITFSPFDIPILEEAPTDFDAFWQTAKDQLSAIPLDSQVTLLSNNGNSTSYRVNLAQVEGRRVYGYITIPAGSGPFPAMITMPSFGNVRNLVQPEMIVAEEVGVIHMTISIHDAEPDEDVSNAYSPNDINDPNQIYNKFAILAGVRAVDYIFTRPDFDGTNIGVMGVSQGAGLSTILAGLDNRINLLIHSNPTNSQLLGIKYDKASGFPYYLTSSSTTLQERNVKYYEAAYFAQRYTGPSWTLISYEDLVTPAAGSFATFNQFTGPKILTNSIELNHIHPAEYWNGRYNFIRRYFTNPSSGSTGYFINAGNDQIVPANANVTLSGTIQLEDQTNPDFPVRWSQLDGPGTVTFNTPNQYSTTANFSTEGTYTLQLLARDETMLTDDQQFFTLIDQVEITVGDCTDDDNDGVCAIEDCDDRDANIPAAIGSSCDDGNELTENDVIQEDGCSCLGTIPCRDEDEDGICLADDCDDNNPAIPAAIGSPCDDGNENTINDAFQTDGCTCLGASGGPANCTVITAVGGPNQITISGLVAESEDINIVGAPTNWQNILVCNGDCVNTEVISDLDPGTYFVKINNYGDDGSYCYFTLEVAVTDGPCPDEDGDGICAIEDCDDTNPSIPANVGAVCDDNNDSTFNDTIQEDGCSCVGLALCSNGDAPVTPGTTCNDENEETENDVIQEDGCTCLGTVPCTDDDGDGVCITDDCDDTNPSIPAPIGTICDDGDALTENDVIQTDGCTCSGAIPSIDPVCDDVQVAIQGNTMQITNITAPIAIIKVFAEDYGTTLLNCFSDCGTSQTIADLTPQTYHLDIQFYTTSWSQICIKTMDIEFSQFQSNATSRSRQIEVDRPFMIYPNPTRDQVFLTIPKAFRDQAFNLQIINALGQSVLHHSIQSNGETVYPIRWNYLNKGIYLFQIEQEGKVVFVEKVIVKE